MPTLSNFLHCEETYIDDETGTPVIKTPIPIIRLLKIPSSFSFSVVFSIVGVDTTEKDKHFMIYQFLNPIGEPIIETKPIDISFHGNNGIQNDLPREMRGVMFGADFRNIEFKLNGIYKSRVILDGEILGEYELPVLGRDGVENE
jgi:hypothetical protein